MYAIHHDSRVGSKQAYSAPTGEIRGAEPQKA
jgi:hypothetical protein